MLIESYGLADADDILFYGESGSGVGTFLALDSAASKVPDVPIVRGTVVGSYIIEYEETDEDGFVAQCGLTYDFHNIEAQISSACIAKNSDAPHHCMIAPYAAEYIRTPLFMFNSKYDSYQLVNIVGEERDGVYANKEALTTYKEDTLKFGEAWLEAFQQFEILNNTLHSAFLVSCICHCACGPDGGSFFDIPIGLDKYVEWYYSPHHEVYDLDTDVAANYDCNNGDLDNILG